MKTIKTLLALLCVLNINAGAKASEESALSLGGSAEVGYRSDYYYRGASKSQDALYLGVGASTSVEGVAIFADLHSNQPDGGSDFTLTTVGAGVEFADSLLAVYGGIVNQDDDSTGSELDVFITGKINTSIAVQATLYRNTDDELYTLEASASKGFDLNVVSLNVSIDVGTTEEVGNTRTYVGGTAVVAKQFGAVSVEAGGSLINTDESQSDESVFAGLSFSF
jgi:hypothetical protein